MVKLYTKMQKLLISSLAIFCPSVFAGDLSQLASDLMTPLTGVLYVMKILMWVGGAGLIFGGIIQYKAHRDNPSQVRLTRPVMMWIMGAIFVILPFIMIKVLQGSGIYIN